MQSKCNASLQKKRLMLVSHSGNWNLINFLFVKHFSTTKSKLSSLKSVGEERCVFSIRVGKYLLACDEYSETSSSFYGMTNRNRILWDQWIPSARSPFSFLKWKEFSPLFLQGRPRLPLAHRHHQHGLALDVLRHHLLSRHHRLQHELHAEIRPREVWPAGNRICTYYYFEGWAFKRDLPLNNSTGPTYSFPSHQTIEPNFFLTENDIGQFAMVHRINGSIPLLVQRFGSRDL